MRTDTTVPAQRDILRNWRQTALAYWVPIAAIVASGNASIGDGWRTAIWTAACLTMGGACLLNAIRCGRVHCWFTGPFFIALVAITVLFGVGALPLGPNGWNIIGLTLLVGGVTLMYGPELILGKYRERKSSKAN